MRRALLARAVDALGADERRLLALAKLEGLDAAEIARITGTSEEGAARELARLERELVRSVRAAGRAVVRDGSRDPHQRATERGERTRWRA